MSRRTIAITGGIGSGKSVVSHVLRAMGYPVYDCDSEARRLMDNSPEIKRRLSSEISPDAVGADGCINRKAISAVVFADSRLLARLNEIVHGEVRDDIRRRLDTLSDIYCGKPLFVETAILYESGLDSLVDEVWEVTAPEEIRLNRVINRSRLKRSEVMARIRSQKSPSLPHHKIIVNDGTTPVLPQIIGLLQ